MSSIRILPVEDATDFAKMFPIEAAAFATQSNDNFWITHHPGWQDPSKTPPFIASRVKRWQSTTTDNQGRPNAIFLKAVDTSIQDPDGKDKIVGLATWVQASLQPGYGDAPIPGDLAAHQAISKEIYPDDEETALFLSQARISFQAFRRSVAEEKKESEQPNFMILDICAVHPDYQGKGIAKQLVQWGLDEARRRGGLECTTEASGMGRRVYAKLGFAMGPDVVYEVDERFKGRSLPDNMSMRTGGFS